jgi:hypothetical protein
MLRSYYQVILHDVLGEGHDASRSLSVMNTMFLYFESVTIDPIRLLEAR